MANNRTRAPLNILDESDQRDNEALWRGHLSMAWENLTRAQKALQTKERLENLKNILTEFTNINHITLKNLEPEEEVALNQILVKKISGDPMFLLADLEDWKKGLKNAVAGIAAPQSATNQMHANQGSTGIAQDLKETRGYLDYGVWLTDLDIDQSLKSAWTQYTDAKGVTTAGEFILHPISLTQTYNDVGLYAENADPTAALKDCLQTIIDKNIPGKVELFIPVNSDTSHWRLASITIENSKITKAELWDSLGSRDKTQTERTPPYQNFLKAIRSFDTTQHQARVTTEFATIQTNGWSCGDLVVQKAYASIGMRAHDIVNANNPADLRLAIVKEIAKNNDDLNVKNLANTITLDNIGFSAAEQAFHKPLDALNTVKEAESLLNTIAAKNHETTQAEKAWQTTFDFILAENLNELYNDGTNDNKSDKELLRIAKQQTFTALGFGLFTQDKNKSPAKTAPQVTPTSAKKSY